MSNDKQSSIIDWLMQQAKAWNVDTRDGSHYITFPKTAFEQAKAMHKEEITNAINFGQNNHTLSLPTDNEIAEQYYNETYGGNNE